MISKARAARAIVTSAVVLATAPAIGAEAWTKRMFDLGNTSNVGDAFPVELDPKDLVRVGKIAVDGQLNATPILSDGLLFVGDRPDGRLYVADVATRKRIVLLETESRVVNGIAPGHTGIEAAGVFGEVTVPVLDESGNATGETTEEKRFYIGVHRKPESFWCLNVTKILADRAALVEPGAPVADGRNYLCEGPDGSPWPRYIGAAGDPVDYEQHPLPAYDASPVFLKDQDVLVPSSGQVETRDLLVLPSLGDCSDGQVWAYDAWTGEIFWIFDSVPNVQDIAGLPDNAPNARVFWPGIGGQIWTVPAVNERKDITYVTTGNCFTFKQQVGFRAQSIVALDLENGEELWYHQRRLADTFDMDVGNSATVVDSEACNVVVTPDKNGCVYAHDQEIDIPDAGDPGFDPLRPGQQRVLWRTCLVPGSLTGGFRAQAAAAHDRYVFAQSSAIISAPGDNVNGFLLDACTGELLWATSAVGKGSAEAAIANGMIFHPSGQNLQVFRAGPEKELLATVELSNVATAGGGGPAIVGERIYVPVQDGVDVIAWVPTPDGDLSPPAPPAADTYNGPYPYPIATGIHDPTVEEMIRALPE